MEKEDPVMEVMVEENLLPKIVYCLSCLATIEIHQSNQSYELKSGAFKAILQVDNITLCHLCRRIAQHSEVLIQNVQSNQILLQNLHVITDSTIQTIRTSVHPPVRLIHVPLLPIQLDRGVANNEDSFVVYNNRRPVEIKLELKCEDSNLLDDYDNDLGLCEDNDSKLELNGLDDCIKEEDEYPLKLLKQELEQDGIRIKSLRKSKKSKVKTKGKSKACEIEPNCDISDEKIQHLRLSIEECLQERTEKLLDEAYVNAELKCEDCVKWFSYKASYEKHMETHDESNGDYVCDICKQRRTTEEKLLHHKRYHTQRYKCLECGLTRLNRLTIEDHYRSKHCNGGLQLSCPYCFKGFRRKVSLKKHVRRVHWAKEKVVCAHCNKLYKSKETLKNHMFRRHTDEAGRRSKKHACAECGKTFESPSHLKNHSIKHSHSKDFYCVECDKSFKSDYILKHHLKTAMSHNSYKDLPLPCSQCKKRFAIRRDLDRHMNRVHLNIKPFQCDQCDKAYVNNWSLTEHRRLVHEGYKRPLRFPCPMCDKIFDRNTILKSHIRTHTGERPYQCSKCPSAFSQAGVLGTHVKLVHLKLTRDGRPKTTQTVNN